jgi:hypothetical protein
MSMHDCLSRKLQLLPLVARDQLTNVVGWRGCLCGRPDLAGYRGAQAARSRAVVESHDLADIGQPGDGWAGAEPATLERVMLHLLQEYARHIGHLDIVSELADGQTGE